MDALPVNYDEISKVYDDVRRADAVLVGHFLRGLVPGVGARVLDVGCGTGNHARLLGLLAPDLQIFGLEPSRGMVAKAQGKNSRVCFVQARAEAMPFARHAFDFIYMTDVIHHIADLDAMFAQVWRVLAEQGRLCVVTQSHRQIENRPVVEFFPGTARVDKARYPDLGAVTWAALRNGVECYQQESLFEGDPLELGLEYLELVRKKGWSMLHLLPEGEYGDGLRRLEEALKEGSIMRRAAGETLLWFRRSG